MFAGRCCAARVDSANGSLTMIVSHLTMTLANLKRFQSLIQHSDFLMGMSKGRSLARLWKTRASSPVSRKSMGFSCQSHRSPRRIFGCAAQPTISTASGHPTHPRRPAVQPRLWTWQVDMTWHGPHVHMVLWHTMAIAALDKFKLN